MKSDETVKHAGDRERAPLTDNSVGQQLRSDELSLEKLYIELTGASEAQARSVFMLTSLGRREVECPNSNSLGLAKGLNKREAPQPPKES